MVVPDYRFLFQLYICTVSLIILVDAVLPHGCRICYIPYYIEGIPEVDEHIIHGGLADVDIFHEKLYCIFTL